jgi:hypothetical protein
MTVDRRPVASRKPVRVGKIGSDRVATRETGVKVPLRHGTVSLSCSKGISAREHRHTHDPNTVAVPERAPGSTPGPASGTKWQLSPDP